METAKHGLMTVSELFDAYDDFGAAERRLTNDYDYDPSGWGGTHDIFDRLVRLVRPRLAIEVGTWKGRSALHTADCLERDAPDCQLICIDTWLGATEFVGAGGKRDLMSHIGYPRVYYQFLRNVLERRQTSRIVPFPQSSTNALRYLHGRDVLAQLIYIDASHEYQDVALDISDAFGILDAGGIMFGDDYCDHWWGVKRAVDEAAELMGKTLQTFRYDNGPDEPPSDYWVLSDGAESI